MFVTRATRHDKQDVRELLDAHGWTQSNLDEGIAFIARDGPVVGCVRLVEVAPGQVMVESMLVRDDRRGDGIGTRLLQTAMNSRGGTLYLCCHPEHLAFYERFDFAEVDPEACPSQVVDFWRKNDEYPAPDGHVHHFMKAR